MLHSPVYNRALTPELKQAYMNRDVGALDERIMLLASKVSDKLTYLEYNVLLSKLQVALALRDSLANGGETLSFTMDYINL